MQFSVYEKLKSLANEASTIRNTRAGTGTPRRTLDASAESSVVLFAMGAASKAVATTVTYPYQVVKSRMQQRPVSGAEGASAAAYRGFWTTVAATARHEGARGFYRGFAANLVRVAPQSAITLLVYERIRGALDSGAEST